MDTLTVIQESQPTKKSNISLRQLIDIDETGGVRAEVTTAEGNIRHNQILTAYAEQIDINGTLGKVKVFRFKNLVSLMSGGTGISVSTNPNNLTTITNTGVTSIIAGTGITVSGATGDITIDSTGGGDMLKSVYDIDNDGIVDQAECVKIIVRNSTGVTLTKGQVVYLFGATGNRPNAVLADATTEATSSKTIGLVSADILNNADGYVTISGTMHDLALNMFAAGDRLWLSTTPGGMVANTPPAEPNHAVFIGTVARAHPTLGRIVLAIQNGYELDELHGVSAPTPANNDILQYDSVSTLWKNESLSSAGIQPTITLTTTGTSGAATLVGATLNVPQYAAGSSTVYVFNMNSFATPNNSLFYGVYLGGTPVNPAVVATQFGGGPTDFFPGYPMPAGTASTLVVILRIAQVAPTSAMTLKLANTSTSTFGPVITIAAGSAAGTYTDNSATVSFTTNQRLTIVASNPFVSGATAGPQLTTGSFRYAI
jgi:hypothetical protein